MNKGKGKLSYEDSITTMATAYFAKQEWDVSSRESRQMGPTSYEIFEQVVDIVIVMSEFTSKQKFKALEHLRINTTSHKMFIKFSHDTRLAYI